MLYIYRWFTCKNVFFHSKPLNYLRVYHAISLFSFTFPLNPLNIRKKNISKRCHPTQISAGWYYEVRVCEVESRGMSYGSVGGLGIGVTKQSASQSSVFFLVGCVFDSDMFLDFLWNFSGVWSFCYLTSGCFLLTGFI